jgi:hypothetical protein
MESGNKNGISTPLESDAKNLLQQISENKGERGCQTILKPDVVV